MQARIIKFLDGPAAQLLYFAQKKKVRTVSLYGAGAIGQETFYLYQQSGITVSHWYDKDYKNFNYRINNLTIKSPEQLEADTSDALVICSVAFIEEILHSLEENHGSKRFDYIRVC